MSKQPKKARIRVYAQELKHGVYRASIRDKRLAENVGLIYFDFTMFEQLISQVESLMAEIGITDNYYIDIVYLKGEDDE